MQGSFDFSEDGGDMEMAFMSWDSLASSAFGSGGRTEKVGTVTLDEEPNLSTGGGRDRKDEQSKPERGHKGTRGQKEHDDRRHEGQESDRPTDKTNKQFDNTGNWNTFQQHTADQGHQFNQRRGGNKEQEGQGGTLQNLYKSTEKSSYSERGRGSYSNRERGSHVDRGRGSQGDRGRGSHFDRGRGSQGDRGRGSHGDRGRGSHGDKGRGYHSEGGRGDDAVKAGPGSILQNLYKDTGNSSYNNRGRGSYGDRGRGSHGDRGRGSHGDSGRGSHGDSGRGSHGDSGRGSHGDKGRGYPSEGGRGDDAVKAGPGSILQNLYKDTGNSSYNNSGRGSYGDRGRGSHGDRGRGSHGDRGRGSSGDRGRGSHGDQGRGSHGDIGRGSNGDRGRGSSDDRGRGSHGDRGRGSHGDRGSGSHGDGKGFYSGGEDDLFHDSRNSGRGSSNDTEKGFETNRGRSCHHEERDTGSHSDREHGFHNDRDPGLHRDGRQGSHGVHGDLQGDSQYAGQGMRQRPRDDGSGTPERRGLKRVMETNDESSGIHSKINRLQALAGYDKDAEGMKEPEASEEYVNDEGPGSWDMWKFDTASSESADQDRSQPMESAAAAATSQKSQPRNYGRQDKQSQHQSWQSSQGMQKGQGQQKWEGQKKFQGQPQFKEPLTGQSHQHGQGQQKGQGQWKHNNRGRSQGRPDTNRGHNQQWIREGSSENKGYHNDNYDGSGYQSDMNPSFQQGKGQNTEVDSCQSKQQHQIGPQQPVGGPDQNIIPLNILFGPTPGDGTRAGIMRNIMVSPFTAKKSSSLALAKDIVDTARMSTLEQLRMLKEMLERGKQRVNAIATLDNAMNNIEFRLRHEYTYMEVSPKFRSRSVFTGRLSINGKYIARSMAFNKRDLKHDVFKLALETIISMTPEEIMSQVDPGAAVMRAEFDAKMVSQVPGTGVFVTGSGSLKGPAAEGPILEENFERLVHHLKGVKLPDLTGDNVNAIRILERHIIASRCSLRMQFNCEEVLSICGRCTYKGNLLLDNVLVGKSKAYVKKLCRMYTFADAVNTLKTKTLQELLNTLPDLPEAENEFLDLVATDDEQNEESADLPPLCIGHKPKDTSQDPLYVKPNLKCSSIVARLEGLVSCLKQTPLPPVTENVHEFFDKLAVELGLNPVCVIRKLQPPRDAASFSYELYLDNILIAKAYGKRTANLRLEAYTAAWKTLSTTGAEEIIGTQPKLDVVMAADPSVYFTRTQGFGEDYENNCVSLRHFRRDPFSKFSTLDKMILFEYQEWSGDRLSYARRILHLSATLSGLVVHWKSSPVTSLLKESTTSIQSVTMATANHFISLPMARRMSCALALFKLYKDHSVIKIMQPNDSLNWIDWPAIQTQASQLKMYAQGADLSNTDEQWRQKVVEIYLKNFHDNCPFKELIFGPGAMPHELKAWRECAREYQLNAEVRLYSSRQYLVILPSYSPHYLLTLLQQNPQTSVGMFKLVPASQLPSQQDLDLYIKKISDYTNPRKKKY